jgi:hypothetical protein
MVETDDGSAAERDAQPLEQGQVVFHAMLGFGVVEADERDGRVSVAMSSGGHKEFATRFARLVCLSSTPLPEARADETFEPLPEDPEQWMPLVPSIYRPSGSARCWSTPRAMHSR